MAAKGSKRSDPSRLDELMDGFIDALRAVQKSMNPRIESALRSAPRHLFVDRYYGTGKTRRLIYVDPKRPTRRQLETIYSDAALLTHRNPPSSTSQPSLVVQMLTALGVERGDRILEIGAGTGWNAVLMAHLAGRAGSVLSVDIQTDVARRARRHVRRAGGDNVTIVTGDGFKGHIRGAPYDRIITTVACPDVFSAWVEQLRDKGTLLVTLDEIPGDGRCLLIRLRKTSDHLRGKILSLPGFMTLTGKYGVSVPSVKQGHRRLVALREKARTRMKPAPWQPWHSGMRREMLRDFLFFSTLEGLGVESFLGRHILSTPLGPGCCITHENDVELCDGDACFEELGRIYRSWLDLGSPRRTSYDVEVWPAHAEKRGPRHGWLLRRQHSRLIFRLKK